jgi:hypothetical protein
MKKLRERERVSQIKKNIFIFHNNKQKRENLLISLKLFFSTKKSTERERVCLFDLNNL